LQAEFIERHVVKSNMVYACIHIPKTAGSTMRHILRQNFGYRHCDIKVPPRARSTRPWLTAKDVNTAKRVYPNVSGFCGHRVSCFSGMSDAIPELRYFTIIREPLTRFISHFHHYHLGRTDSCTIEDLKEFASHPDYRNTQTRWLCGSENAEDAIRMIDTRIDVVGVTERLDESVLMIGRWLGLDDSALRSKPLNTSRGIAPLQYRESPELMSIIMEANESDMRVYRYVIDECFPRQLAAAGGEFDGRLRELRQANAEMTRIVDESWAARIRRNWVYKPMLHFTS
jgi:hypothetical protein